MVKECQGYCPGRVILWLRLPTSCALLDLDLVARAVEDLIRASGQANAAPSAARTSLQRLLSDPCTYSDRPCGAVELSLFWAFVCVVVILGVVDRLALDAEAACPQACEGLGRRWEKRHRRILRIVQPAAPRCCMIHFSVATLSQNS